MLGEAGILKVLVKSVNTDPISLTFCIVCVMVTDSSLNKSTLTKPAGLFSSFSFLVISFINNCKVNIILYLVFYH